MEVGASSDLEELVRADLAAFADPGTDLTLSREQAWIAAEWQEDGRQRSARFLVENRSDLREIVVRPEGGKTQIPYATFLSSDRMGDLKGLARNTLQVVQKVD